MRISEGEKIPKFYGIAWREFLKKEAVCFPIPFNWIARWARATWLKLEVPRHTWFEAVENRMRTSLESERRKYEEKVRIETDRRVDEAVKLISNTITGGKNVIISAEAEKNRANESRDRGLRGDRDGPKV